MYWLGSGTHPVHGAGQLVEAAQLQALVTLDAWQVEAGPVTVPGVPARLPHAFVPECHPAEEHNAQDVASEGKIFLALLTLASAHTDGLNVSHRLGWMHTTIYMTSSSAQTLACDNVKGELVLSVGYILVWDDRQ